MERTLTPGTLRAQLAALSHTGDPWGVPPGSQMDRLMRGRPPVTFSRQQIEAFIAPCDRPVDLADAEVWVLTGPDTLTPAD